MSQVPLNRVRSTRIRIAAELLGVLYRPITLEIVVATSLIVARSGTRPLLIPAILFFAFALQLTYLLSHNRQSCNCLSGLIQYESSKEIMRLQILVNVAFAVLCAALGVWNPTMAKGAFDGTARTHAT